MRSWPREPDADDAAAGHGHPVPHLLVGLRARAHGAIALSDDLMYAGYGERRVTAWNWSFLPLDVLFSLTGIAAVRLAAKGNPTWRPVALISLCLTFVAGLMAVSYWTLLREFDPAWFLPNLLLMAWPPFFLPDLLRTTRP